MDYMSQPGVKAPPMITTGMKAGGVMKGTFAKTMASQITGMANGFIAGTDAKDALPKLTKLWKNGLAFSVDLLGEACVSDAEADMYLQKYLDLVENLPAAVKDWTPNERLEKDHLGDIPRTNVSIKVSSLTAQTDPIAFERVIDQSMARIVPILEAAKSRGVFINFDMESFATKDLTIELFKRCCRAVDFEGGIAMQAYLRSGDADATDMVEWAKAEGREVTVRLVKGAYWDYETIHAEEMGWPQPVWPTKPHTDACFERMARTFVGSTPTRKGEGGEAEGDRFTNIEFLYGSDFEDVLTGDAGVNRLVGREGDDVLNGMAGDDVLRGGEGADHLIGGEGDRDAAEYGWSHAGVTVSLADNLATGGEAEGDTFDSIEYVYGSRYDDAITGDDAVNRLVGKDGDDVLSGMGGNDYLLGGNGDDTMTGGEGDDVFQLEGTFGDDVITDFEAGEGRTDRVWLRDNDFGSYDELMASLVDTADGVLLDMGEQGSLTFTELTVAELVSDDFII